MYRVLYLAEQAVSGRRSWVLVGRAYTEREAREILADFLARCEQTEAGWVPAHRIVHQEQVYP